MITDQDAFRWIQTYRADPLVPGDSVVAQQLLDRSTHWSSRQALANHLDTLVPDYPVPAARAYLCTLLGLFFIESGDCDKAVNRLTQAAKDYNGVIDFHSLGAVLWLMGITCRKMDQHHKGFVRWKESRDLMIYLYRETERLKRIKKPKPEEPNYPYMEWYDGLIQNMTVEMLGVPRDMFEWTYAGPDAPKQTLFPLPESGVGSSAPLKPSVYRFKRGYDSSDSSMGSSVSLMREKIDELIESRGHQRIPVLMRSLEGMNQGPPSREFCEIHTYCATLADFYPEREEVIQHLITARCASPLLSRSRMIVTWMLGLLWIKDPNYCRVAIRSMEESITCARRLEAAADRENDSALQQWYHWHAEAMQRVLKEHVQAIS